jgi:Cu/Ag efflux pump CusA
MAQTKFGELFIVYCLSAAAAFCYCSCHVWPLVRRRTGFLTLRRRWLTASLQSLSVAAPYNQVACRLVAVIGLAAHGALVSPGRYQDEGGFEDRQSAVDRIRSGALERFGPALASAITSALVFAPLLYFRGPGLEILHPMAIVVVGGVAASILTILFVLPPAYLTMIRIKRTQARPALYLVAA